MSEYTRGEFLGAGGLLLAKMGLGSRYSDPRSDALGESSPGPTQISGPGAPDLVVLNGRVYTIDAALPRAEAFAVKDGRFVAVGSSEDVRNLVAPGTEILDAAGMTVTPGFIDAHSHPSGAGLAHLTRVDANLGSIVAIQEAIRDRVRRTPPGEWVVAFMYDDTKLDEGRPLNRLDLDAVAPENPVVVGHRGGHTSVYNSIAFQLAGVTVETNDPADGRFYREDGELTGLVAEAARDVFSDLIPTGADRDQRREGVALISRMMTAAGLTSVHQAAGGTDDLVAYQDAYEAGELRFRMYFFPTGDSDCYEALKRAGIRTGFGDSRLRIGAVKYFADGSASERTMAMSEPYVDRPDDYGISTMTQEEIHAAVEDARRHGFQIGIHANGDVAIDRVLNAFERVQERIPSEDPRFRIEHCTLVNPELLSRIRDVGAIPTPFYTYVYYHGDKWEAYGDERLRWMFAHRSFLDYGIPVAGASDYTPGPFEPMMALQSLVTRTDFRGRIWGPNQRLSVDEALRVCTINGAHASFEEDVKGSISPGKYADFVFLGEDPHEVAPERLKDVPVLRTAVGGRIVHEA